LFFRPPAEAGVASSSAHQLLSLFGRCNPRVV